VLAPPESIENLCSLQLLLLRGRHYLTPPA
jgi:hypothetical protein